MLTNLLTNAVKFTPPGGRITVNADRQGDHVALAVADTGIGIPPEELDRIVTLRARCAELRSGAGRQRDWTGADAVSGRPPRWSPESRQFSWGGHNGHHPSVGRAG
jgi:hypothetical protein